MIFVPRDASDEQVLDVVHYWIDALAREEYASVFSALGYALAYQFEMPGPEIIRRAIMTYRSPRLFPNVENFIVTDWRTARGGNPEPLQKITWYKQNDIGLVGSLEIDLPLNGSWSDLEADFVWFENKNRKEGYVLGLEDIDSSEQQQREDGGV